MGGAGQSLPHLNLTGTWNEYGDDMRINLLVPFEEKDLAKKRGARWDAANKIWYVQDHPRLELFLKWIPEQLKRPTQAKILDKPIFKVTQPRTIRKKKKYH